METLMSDVKKHNHNYFLKQFYTSGKSENLFKSRSIQIKHKQVQFFKAYKYLKYIFSLEQELFEYLSISGQFKVHHNIKNQNQMGIFQLREYFHSIFGNYRESLFFLWPKVISYSEFPLVLKLLIKILSKKLCSFVIRERIQEIQKNCYQKIMQYLFP
ncbi:unnamed protein product [Paramecium sonneborni]|uniref:Uncharacterized protein n=1 Tax=Paramecium sonneborni TaxID=65129 RepID=A0A8S1NXT1_9CILI|nr:unnamed protein product [Paramecium sonneborni]